MAAELIQNLRSNIQKLNQSVSKIESLSNQIGTSKDSNNLRKNLADIQHNSKEIAQDAKRNLKDLNSIPNSNLGELKIQKDRLGDELIKTFQKFQRVTESSLRKEKQTELPEQHQVMFQNEVEEPNFGRRADQISVQIKNEQELQLVKDRENQIHQLESDVIDLNSMFKDLAVIVNDQQETIDTIESNINNTELLVMNAKDELTQAVKNKSKARRKRLYLFIIIAVI
ncbi:syntaxin-12, partial [Brachionus plicatilis]